MAPTLQEYSVDDEIKEFFSQTTTTQGYCDAHAVSLVGGTAIPVAVQGACSYTVYAGPNAASVVQFRLQSLPLPLETTRLAHSVYGSLVPEAEYKGLFGPEGDKENLRVYVMNRIKGVSQLDFILAHGFPEDTEENCERRKTLVEDIARFFACAWNNPVSLETDRRLAMQARYESDLASLLDALPERFHQTIHACLQGMPNIMSLPMVLLHKDFGQSNVMVSEMSCHLTGVIDWAEAEVGPFGLNLFSMQVFMAKFHFRNGWMRYNNYDVLEKAFWDILKCEAHGLTDQQISTVKLAATMGLLLSWGFTSRLANKPEPVPIQDDENGAYQLMRMDGLLLHPITKVR